MPPEYLAIFLEEDETLPAPDAVLGLEEENGEADEEAPRVDELKKNPDVAAVVEATKGLVPAS
ncbi:MAG TPA: hypothetical protein VIE64_09875 [Solirubrobacterales bacterium]|jgi:hypothetical protein